MRWLLVLLVVAVPLLASRAGGGDRGAVDAEDAWSEPDRVPVDSAASPSLALSGDALHVAVNNFSFRYTPDFSVFSDEVWVTTRTGSGWSEPVNVSRTPTQSLTPTIALGPDGARHVVWGERTRDVGSISAVTSLFYATDEGGTWGEAVEIYGATDILSRQAFPISVSILPEGSVHVVFDGRDASGRARVQYLRRSPDGEWDEGPGAAFGYRPDLATADGVLYLSYEPYDPAVDPVRSGDVVVAASRDGGDTWSAPERVYDARAEGPCVKPSVGTRLAVGDGTLLLVWSRDSAFPCGPGEHFVWPREVLSSSRPLSGDRPWSAPAVALPELPTEDPNQYVQLRLAASDGGEAHVTAYSQSGTRLGVGSQMYASLRDGAWSHLRIPLRHGPGHGQRRLGRRSRTGVGRGRRGPR